MRKRISRTVMALSLVFAWAFGSPVNGQSTAPAATAVKPGAVQVHIAACSLASKAEVEKITGVRQYSDSSPSTALGFAGAVCTFENAQIVIFSGERSRQSWDEYLKRFGYGNETRTPVSGLGDSAYVIYPKPKSRGQDTAALVVVQAGQHTLGISVNAPDGKPAESVQPNAVAFTKLVLSKLR